MARRIFEIALVEGSGFCALYLPELPRGSEQQSGTVETASLLPRKDSIPIRTENNRATRFPDVHGSGVRLPRRASLALISIHQKNQPWENLPDIPAGSSPRLAVRALPETD
jgi:hypothetical protein